MSRWLDTFEPQIMRRSLTAFRPGANLLLTLQVQEPSPMSKSVLRLAVSFGVALALAGAALAQTSKPARPSGIASGIKVHGHWTIVVRNPDGSVANRREFENSASLDGADALPALLAGFAVSGGWGIALGSTSPTNGPCPGTPSFGFSVSQSPSFPQELESACLIVQQNGFYVYGSVGSLKQGCNSFGLNNFGCSANLAVTLPVTGTVSVGPTGPFQQNYNVLGLQLQGQTQVTTTVSATLDVVETFVNLCDTASVGTTAKATSLTSASTTSPAQCNSATGGDVLDQTTFAPWIFTGTELPTTPPNTTPGITVIPNQTVQVTVVITFS